MFRILALCITLLIVTVFSVTAANAAPFAYITNSSANTVSVIDTATNNVVGAPIPVGAGPEGLALNPSGTRAYVSNYGGNTVSVIDTSSKSVIATIVVGNYPEGIAVSPDGTRVYVAKSSSSGSVSIIDTATNTVTGSPIFVGSYPFGVAVSPDGSRVYVANNSSGNISVINTSSNTVIDTITAGTSLHGIAVSPLGNRLYVASHSDVLVIDASTKAIVATINVGLWPYGIAINPAGTRVYVANYDQVSVSVVDTATNTLIGSPIAVGHYPAGIAVNNSGTRIYVANQGDNSISVVDAATNTVIGSPIAVGNGPLAFGRFIGPEPTPVVNGLVSLWHAEGNAMDSATGNNGVLQGGATFAPGIAGQAFSFAGGQGYIQVPDSTSLDLTTAFTLSAWVNPAGVDGTLGNAVLSKIGGGGGNNGYQMLLYNNAGNNRLFCAFNASGEGWPANTVSSGSIPLNQWSHIACVYDGADLIAYVNGVEAGRINAPGKSVVNSSSTLRISGDDNDHAYFDGLIDEAAVYNRALNATEIARIYGRFPDPFTFTPQTNASLNTLVESSAITVAGIIYPTAIAISGGEYSISISGSSSWSAWTGATATVNPNDRVKVRLTSSAAYSTQSSAILTIGGVQGIFSVTTIPPPSFAITTSVPGGHGTITCNSPVILGASSTCAITPDPGYHLSSLTDNSADVFSSVSGGQYTIGNVTAPHEVVTGFAINTYTISVSVPGGHGTIGCTSPVDHGGSATCTVTPDMGYHLSGLIDNSTDVLVSVSGGQYTIANVTAIHTLAAAFAINTYTVSASVIGGHGTIDCASPVVHGGSSLCTVTPDTGYHPASLTDNEADMLAWISNGQYTIVNVTAAHTVVATFAINTYTITASVNGGHGTIDCTSPADHGGSSLCTVTPDPAYHLASLADNGADVLASVSNGQYSIANVTAAHTVVAAFAADPLTITVTPGEGGTITCGAPTVVFGGNATCYIVPLAGYSIQDVAVDAESRGTGAIVSFTNVTANHTISALFSHIPNGGPAPRPAGLQAWWRGENSALDITGQYNGIASAGVTYASGMVGEAFGLDGDSHVSVPDGIIPATTRGFTLNVWVNPGNAGSEQVIFHSGSAGGEYALMQSGEFYYFAVHLTGDNPDDTWQIVAAPVTINGWVFVSGVRRANNLELWVNGVMLGSSTIPDLDLWVASTGPTHSNIGAMEGEAGVSFAGLIDELQIYHRALTAGEIVSIYSAGGAGMSETEPTERTLTVTVTGNGGGTVTSAPSAIACTSGTCSALFAAGSTVPLTASPDINSLFDTWSGACSGIITAKCDVIMDADKSAAASFVYVQPARVQGGQDYPHISAAYAALSGSGTILAREFLFTGGLNLGNPTALLLKGGYNPAYSINSAYSTIQGTLTVGRGSLTVERVIIK